MNALISASGIFRDKVLGPAAACLREAGEFPRSFSPALRSALWLFSGLAAAFIIFPEAWLYPWREVKYLAVIDHLMPAWKPLLYGLPLDKAAGLPLTGFLSFPAGNADWAGLQLFWTLLTFFIALSAYGLGCLIAGRAAGAAACAAAFLLRQYGDGCYDMEQRLYCLLLFGAANALAFAARAGLAGRVLEACAVGVSLLGRQVLCWFPVLLALGELFRPGPARRRAASAAVSLALPFLFLLPWTLCNWRLDRSLTLFDGRAQWNMVTGAMGMVSTFEGDYRALAGLKPGENAALWAARKIAASPGVYLRGLGGRVRLVFSAHAAALSLWLLAAVLALRLPAPRRVNALVLYFLAVHLAFSTEDRYFLALFPLLFAVSAASLLALAGCGEARRDGIMAASAGALPAAAAAAFCMFLLIAHPGAPAAGGLPEAEAAAARAPRDAWLLRYHGRRQLAAGDAYGAYKSLGTACVLSPFDTNCRMDLAAAAIFRNSRRGRPMPGADLIEKMPLEKWDHLYPGKDYSLRALYQFYAGRPAAAAISVRRALAARDAFINFKYSADGAAFREDRVRAADTYVSEAVLPPLLGYFPAGLRPGLEDAFLKACLEQGRPVVYRGTLVRPQPRAAASAR